MADEALVLLPLLLLLGGKKKKTEPTGPNDPQIYHFVPGVGEPDKPTVDPDSPKPSNWPTADDVKDYPTDDALFQVSNGYVWSGTGSKRIIANAIAGAAYKAKKSVGASDADALAFATQTSHNQDNRSAYFAAVHRDRWNDQGYGTYGYGSSELADKCTHRAIRLIPQNDSVLVKLAGDEAPTRYMQLKTPASAKQGNAYGKAGGKLPLIWLPKIDRQYLLDTGFVRTVDTMPQWIRDLGWKNLPAGVQWGC